ncbi:hypothetical protein V8F06_013242 [Rhypophila decipiens]
MPSLIQSLQAFLMAAAVMTLSVTAAPVTDSDGTVAFACKGEETNHRVEVGLSRRSFWDSCYQCQVAGTELRCYCPPLRTAAKASLNLNVCLVNDNGALLWRHK